MSRERIEQLSAVVVDSAIRVHSVLGPGLLESAYEACLAHELLSRGMETQRQVTLPVIYDGRRIELGYRIDLMVGRSIIVEVKAVTKLLDVHQAQLLSYLRLSDLRLGFLMNFHVPRMKDGIRRMVNRH